MASIRKLSKELWAELKPIFNDPGIILVPEPVLEQLPADKRAKLEQLIEKGDVDYDFGGDPDHYVDIILSEDQFIMRELLDDDDE